MLCFLITRAIFDDTSVKYKNILERDLFHFRKLEINRQHKMDRRPAFKTDLTVAGKILFCHF